MYIYIYIYIYYDSLGEYGTVIISQTCGKNTLISSRGPAALHCTNAAGFLHSSLYKHVRSRGPYDGPTALYNCSCCFFLLGTVHT